MARRAPVPRLPRTLSPASLKLINGASTVVDVVSYAGNCAQWYEGAGTVLDDNHATNNHGLSRFPGGDNSSDNVTDFAPRCITPGARNKACAAGCGLPVNTASRTWGSLELHHQ